MSEDIKSSVPKINDNLDELDKQEELEKETKDKKKERAKGRKE